MTVEPVVVRAETDSKTASVTVRLVDDSMNGIAPTRTLVTQMRLTNRKPKRGVRRGGAPQLPMTIASARPLTMAPDAAKTSQSALPT